MRLSTKALAILCISKQRKQCAKVRAHMAKHSRYRKEFYNSLDDKLKRLRQRRLSRHSLLHQRRSPWRKLFHSKCDQGMITLTGFDYESFGLVCQKFAPVFNCYFPFGKEDDVTITPKRTRRGRRRIISAEDCLGLVLAWTRTRGLLAVLQMIFGLTMTNLSIYLRFGRRIVIDVFKNDSMATIRLPTTAELNSYIESIAVKHPNLGTQKVWCTVDGLKLMLEQAPNSTIQEQFYN